ncbi:MAG TPA: TetR/AcrR family transcriptional regulator [Solirubrobacterales bacterium]|nr:TetR/AcrR family transcriptional regulator [Solirubrobacterales bacterium]
MVAVCEEKGYERSSVSDLLELSGTSSKTFYQHFTDKQDCFRAAVEEIVRGTIAAIASRLGAGAPSEQRARSAFETFVDLIAEQPAAARIVLVESYAAGEPAIEPVRRAFDEFARLGCEAFDQIPGHEGTPLEISRAIVGGFFQVIYGRLQARREQELPGLVPELWQWGLNFPPPPQPLRAQARRVSPAAPGSMPPFASRSPEQRIIRGFAECVAERGYANTTIASIAAAASISQNTLYEHFDDKSDLLAAALDSSGAQMLAATLPSARRIEEWPHAVRVALGTACDFMAAEPAFARLRSIEVYAAGPAAIAVRDRSGADLLGSLLGPAYADAPTVPPIVAEATLGAIYGVLYEQIRTHGPERLPRISPLLAYLALAPFLGAEQACAVANGNGRGAS